MVELKIARTEKIDCWILWRYPASSDRQTTRSVGATSRSHFRRAWHWQGMSVHLPPQSGRGRSNSVNVGRKQNSDPLDTIFARVAPTRRVTNSITQNWSICFSEQPQGCEVAIPIA